MSLLQVKMNTCIGISGYHYTHWCSREELGCFSFYPDNRSSNFLKEYAKTFDTVEINSTRHRKLTDKMCQRWYDNTPENFKFTIKAGTYITHIKKLNDFQDWWKEFEQSVKHLKTKLGAILFQFHHSFKRNKKNIKKLLLMKEVISKKYHIALEFRGKEWFENTEEFEQLFTKRWMQVIVIIPQTGETFGDMSKGINIGVLNKRYGYVRCHGTDKFCHGTHSIEDIEILASILSQCKYKYGYFNNIDTWTSQPYHTIEGVNGRFPVGIPTQPSAVHNALQLKRML